MAGDKGGWLQAVWVPIVGVAMALVIRLCDRLWSHEEASPHFPFMPSLTLCLKVSSSNSRETLHSLELVHSSLHQSSNASLEDVEMKV
jgi:hypothetical protein